MPNRWPSIAGHRFGRLLVLDEAAGRAARYRLWRCRCDCGYSSSPTHAGEGLRHGLQRLPRASLSALRPEDAKADYGSLLLA